MINQQGIPPDSIFDDDDIYYVHVHCILLM